ncbi:MAG: redoxin domain-containing protein [Myxococcota bacterium]|nr:redoxin domain-containing protein [Myxococcota bacterium]
MSSWKGLKKRAEAFESIGVRVLGVTSDSQAQVGAFHQALGLPFTLVSDPLLQSAQVLGVPVSSAKSYFSTLAVHPVIRELPKKGFLQPAVLVWKEEALVYEWYQVETLRNLFGANGRPSPQQILEIVESSMRGETGVSR